ncbi:hypothetical protein QA601_04310 [Chitinispirillales bacterium ANBcel5]|uniref:hypothetical protein n=1 Tax=Cellulosispirillum alkaliphilum TaxID=3039283 RepID=UPI002A54DCD8|nr:hypothetical protein [Chitinispirillales bacterium ANBcel5]
MANEVKVLAKKAATSSDDIKSKIQNVQTAVGTAVSDVETITGMIKEAEEIVTSIATSMSEQASVTQDISANISKTLSSVKDGVDHVPKIGNEESWDYG